MNEVLRRAGCLLALAWLATPGAAPALELNRGFLEAAYVRDFGGGPADGGPTAVGVAGAARLPVSRTGFVAGWTQRFEPYEDAFGGRHEDENRFGVGLGLTSGGDGQEWVGQLTYLKFENWRSVGNPSRVEGGALSFGGRNMMSERVETDVEVGMGYVEGDGAHELLLTGRGSLAYELAPHAWLYAEGSLTYFDYSVLRVGLRYTFPGRQPARRPPAVRAVERGDALALAVGATVVAQRALQLQIRPAFGAPETIVVPAGGTLSLVETTENAFGRWWRVTHGEQQGWIREGHLK